MSLVTTRQLFKEHNTCQSRSFIICLTENSIIWLEHNKALMEILKQYDGKARNDTGLNYNAAQGFFGLEKYRLQKVTESPILLLLLSFLILSDIHPFIHVHSFIHSFTHPASIMYPALKTWKSTIHSPCFQFVHSLPEKKNTQNINASHATKSAVTEVTGSKRRSQSLCTESSQQEATQRSG